MMDRLRLLRMRRAYRVIHKVELHLKDKTEAADLRSHFASQTIRIIDAWQRDKGFTRNQRRQYRRGIVASR